MLVENIIKSVLKILDKHDIIASMQAGDVLTGEDATEVATLVDCLNLVRNEIATEFIPNAKVEKLKVENNRLDFSMFEGQVIEVLSVNDNFGSEIKFHAFSDHIQLENGTFHVKYNQNPEIITLKGEFVSNIPERVYVYGILKEYYFIQTLYEDASVWDARFKNSLNMLARKKNNTIIRKRGWF